MLTQPLIRLIQSCTGLRIQAQNKVALEQTIQARMKTLKLMNIDQYYQYLTNSASPEEIHLAPLSQEWEHLIQPLIIGESYFLRDKGQFQLLQQHILPTLIQQRREQAAMHRTKPTLRLWSAGCSTGEEAYSLAMVVQQLILDWRDWDLRVIGTDINADAIACAKRGIYDSWSFRSVDAATQAKYFQLVRGKWKLNEIVRSIVTFYPGNLVQDSFPNGHSNLCNIDLIVCRNVFIYFAPESIAMVLKKFARTLNPGGYLITGHTELHNQDLSTLRTKVYPESIVYQRYEEFLPEIQLKLSRQVSTSSLAPIPTPAPAPTPIVPPHEKAPNQWESRSPAPSRNALEEADQCFQKGDYAGTIAIVEPILDQNSQSLELHHLIAQAYLHLGAYEQAKHYAQRIAKIHTLSTAPYYLLAHIAREQKQSEQAKDLLKRIIYLEPTAVTAYLELSSIYAQEGNIAKAEKMKSTALDLMERATK